MPKFEITAPDGGRYEIEAPEGATEAEILKFAEENFDQDGTPSSESIDTSPIDYGVRDELLNTATFGLADRVKAAGETAAQIPFLYDGKDLNISDSYDKNLSGIHGERDRYRKRHPNKSLGAGVVGSFANPLGNVAGRWMGGGKFAGSGLNRAGDVAVGTPLPKQSLGQMMKRGSIGGSGIAGVQAYNEADGDVLDRLDKAKSSLALGGATGAGVPVAVKGGALALKGLANLLSKVGAVGVGGRMPYGGGMQTTLGWRKLAEALKRDGYTIESAAKRLDDLGPQAVIADLGDNTRSLAYSVYSKPSKGSTKVFNFAEKRQKGFFPEDDKAATLQGGQRNRINEKAEEMFPERYQGTQNQGEINKLYSSAYKNNPDLSSKELDFFLKTKTGKKAMERAIGIMSDSRKLAGTPDPALTAAWREAEGGATPSGMGISKGFKLETWDYIKEGLDEVIEKLDPVKERRALKRAVTMKNNLVKELDKLDATGGDYAKARGLSSDNFKNQEAFEFGQKFIRKNVRLDELTSKMSDMGEEQLHNYRIGAIQELRNNIGDMRAGANKAQAMLDDETLQRKIKTVFGDKKKFGEYMELLKNEAEMTKLRTTLGGSRTAKNLASNDDSFVDPNAIVGGLIKMKAGNVLGGGIDILKSLGSKAFMREGTADVLGDALTGRNLSGMKTVYKAKEASRKAQNALSSKAIQGVSPLIGRDDVTLEMEKQYKRKKGMLSN